MSTAVAAPPARRTPARRRLRTVAALLAALLLLALAAVGGIGWYYSGQLLDVSHAAEPYDVRVAAVSAGTVTLPRTTATTRPGVYGLFWPGGAGVLRQVLDSNGGTVTRRLQLTAGTLRGGTRARLDTDVWAGDPRSAIGLNFRAVAVPGPVGSLPSWLVPAAGAHAGTWVVLVHGRGDGRKEGLRVLPALHRAGLPTLSISYRNDLGAPKSPDGLYHLGDSEWRDVEAAVRFARHNGATDVVLFGYSMGGAIVEAFLDRSPQAAAVRAVVLDAPVLDWRATLTLQAGHRNLPALLTTVAEQVVSRRVGIDFDRFDVPEQPGRVTLPTLLFHGTSDQTVPIGPSRQLARLRPQAVEFHPVRYADHTQAWNVDPGGYERILTTFLTGRG